MASFKTRAKWNSFFGLHHGRFHLLSIKHVKYLILLSPQQRWFCRNESVSYVTAAADNVASHALATVEAFLFSFLRGHTEGNIKAHNMLY